MDKLAGYVGMALGVLWTVWPQILRGWLVRKASWALYWLLVGAIFLPASAYAKPWGIKGYIALGIGLTVAGSLLRGLISKLSERLPLIAFRIIGFSNLLLGLYLVFLKK